MKSSTEKPAVARAAITMGQRDVNFPIEDCDEDSQAGHM